LLPACPAVATTEVGDVDGGLPRAMLMVGAATATTEVEDVDDGPPGGAAGISDSGHRRSPSGIHEVLELKVQEHPPST
jgi:hypothetical protein